MGIKRLRFKAKRAAKKPVCGFTMLMVCAVLFLSGCADRGAASSREEKDAAQEQTENLQETSDVQADAKDGSSSGTAEAGNETVGDFTMQDINGETYTQKMFENHELTMLNVFTTWCTPCIGEIPDLAKLHEDLADEGVQVAGIVMDAVGRSGDTDEEAVEKAKLLAEKAEVTYPFLIPDAGYLNGRLAEISAVPTTFFVDQEGNVVGETYTGARSYEEWKSVIEKELSEVAK